jgi:phosphatidylglycerophosphate synthase
MESKDDNFNEIIQARFMMDPTNRRPLESRQTKWARDTAAFLARMGASPNHISLVSIAFSALSLWMYYLAINSALEWLCLLLAAVFIQLRLLCNLFDGMVAIEHHRRSKLGDLYNEVPDRVADLFIIMGVGIYCWGQPYALSLAWFNVFLAVFTAYLRALGASLGTGHIYSGPMAKPHRMALLTAITLLQIFLPSIPVLYFSLYLMAIGMLITCYRRLHKIAEVLRQ